MEKGSSHTIIDDYKLEDPYNFAIHNIFDLGKKAIIEKKICLIRNNKHKRNKQTTNFLLNLHEKVIKSISNSRKGISYLKTHKFETSRFRKKEISVDKKKNIYGENLEQISKNISNRNYKKINKYD